MDYPYKECIQSMLDCCDEVVVLDCSVVDGNNKEQHKDELSDLIKQNQQSLVVLDMTDQAKEIWNTPNSGIWDGKMKAIARGECTGEYLLQMDSDEIIEENARPKIDNLIKQINGLNPPAPPIVACPVIEYWGSSGQKVRIDVNPWKWRISKNDSRITHGIPVNLRKIDPKTNLLHAHHGTDGCDYIYADSGEVVPCANFMNNDIETLRRAAVLDPAAAKTYEQWFNILTNELPTIFHFSWWNIERKISNYGHFWNKSWSSLYGEERPEGYNPFFPDQHFNEITEEEKRTLAMKLEQECGGHIFHTKWNGLKTNHVTISKPIPAIVKTWCDKWKRENKATS